MLVPLITVAFCGSRLAMLSVLYEMLLFPLLLSDEYQWT